MKEALDNKIGKFESIALVVDSRNSIHKVRTALKELECAALGWAATTILSLFQVKAFHANAFE